MNRRAFVQGMSVAVAAARWAPAAEFDIAAIERPRVMRNAAKWMDAPPETVTASSSKRSAGGKHDYFSEGDYWWPDPKNPDGPYIQRDGMSNPDNFDDHRKALIRFSQIVPALAAAYKLTKDRKYSARALVHLRAWFVDETTRMNPNLEYAQAIPGSDTGRPEGVLDGRVLIPNQEAADGSFPLELARTKPYGYSLFNLDAMSILAQTLTTPDDNLWKWQMPDGRGMAKAVAYMYPYMADKKTWPKPPDVMYFDQWPVRQPSLLFAGLALGKPEYLALWQKLESDPAVEEVLRNWPVRQPVLWV